MRHSVSATSLSTTGREAQGHTRRSLAPYNRFGAAWVAAFLGVVLIIGVIFWAITALP